MLKQYTVYRQLDDGTGKWKTEAIASFGTLEDARWAIAQWEHIFADTPVEAYSIKETPVTDFQDESWSDILNQGA